MKRLCSLVCCWLLATRQGSTIPEVDVSSLEAPVAQAIVETVKELQNSPKSSPQYWANYAEVLQAHQLYEIGGRVVDQR